MIRREGYFFIDPAATSKIAKRPPTTEEPEPTLRNPTTWVQSATRSEHQHLPLRVPIKHEFRAVIDPTETATIAERLKDEEASAAQAQETEQATAIATETNMVTHLIASIAPFIGNDNPCVATWSANGNLNFFLFHKRGLLQALYRQFQYRIEDEMTVVITVPVPHLSSETIHVLCAPHDITVLPSDDDALEEGEEDED